VDRQSPALQLSSVVLNNKKGGFLATRHLLEQGHRQIAYLSGPPNLVSARERYEGYLWAYREAALKAPEDAVFHGDYLFQSGYRAADAIWSGGFTAVACGNDLMAYGLIKRFRELGLDLPAKMSIVGFDDLSYSELISPALTTVAQSGHAIGYQACKIAFQEIENPHAHHQTILLEPELIIRDSTAVWRKEE
jgi:LacI family transcriptional regulator